MSQLERYENDSSQRIDKQCQTDHHQHDKLVYTNNKLKQTVQTIKDKLQHIVTEKENLFLDVNDDPIDRLDHLISIIDKQSTRQNEDVECQTVEEYVRLRVRVREVKY